MTLNSKSYLVIDADDLHDVKCPKCDHYFLIAEFTYNRKFTCIKCGSEWYGGLPLE